MKQIHFDVNSIKKIIIHDERVCEEYYWVDEEPIKKFFIMT